MARINYAFAVFLCAIMIPSAARADDMQQNWDFVQSVGGMSVGTPVRTSAQGWSLPVKADVSGFKKITVEPTTWNAGIYCKEMRAVIEGNGIFLTLITARNGFGPVETAKCPAASLGTIAPGAYTVYYRIVGDPPVKLAEVTVAP